MSRFEELDVWKRSARLSANLYVELAGLRDFGFRDQITRAGLSIPSNIAEGYERNSDKELANFLNYAKGSAGELRTQVYIGIEIGYIKHEIGTVWLKECEEISKMLYGLIHAVRGRIEK
ncbi:MAG: four helix bundle protein [Gallionella sp.]|jgi:four helix bundle protein